MLESFKVLDGNGSEDAAWGGDAGWVVDEGLGRLERLGRRGEGWWEHLGLLWTRRKVRKT